MWRDVKLEEPGMQEAYRKTWVYGRTSSKKKKKKEKLVSTLLLIYVTVLPV
jgi:hypothetical protein